MFEGLSDVFHLDKSLGFGVFDACLRQVSSSHQALGFRSHGSDLSFELFFLGLFRIIPRRSATQHKDQENRPSSHKPFDVDATIRSVTASSRHSGTRQRVKTSNADTGPWIAQILSANGFPWL